MGHCLALYHDSQTRIAELEQRLRQYGYNAQYTGPVAADPLAHLNREAAAAAGLTSNAAASTTSRVRVLGYPCTSLCSATHGLVFSAVSMADQIA